MHEITPRKTVFSRAVIAMLLLIFVGQAFAVTGCPQAKAEHQQMLNMSQGYPLMVDAGTDSSADCCAEASCDMASCLLILSPEMPAAEANRHDGGYLSYIERSENNLITSLFRPPIVH